MADQTNNFDNSGVNNSGNIMKELSDIKTSLAVNTSETQNIKDTLAEVKADVKEMKKNYINQEQHKVLCDSNTDHETRIRGNETNITRIMTWGSALVVVIGILEFVINKFVK
jgi:hypothetical protein